jgi:hypothetical protein
VNNGNNEYDVDERNSLRKIVPRYCRAQIGTMMTCAGLLEGLDRANILQCFDILCHEWMMKLNTDTLQVLPNEVVTSNVVIL